MLVSRATKKPLAAYLSEKVWGPPAWSRQATWILSKTGQEISGCCIQAASRDFARFGQFILNGAQVGGTPIVPEGWLEQATTGRTAIGQPGAATATSGGPTTTGAFTARGIFGQGLFIDPKRKLVIASNGDWGGGARDPAASAAREAFYLAVQKAVDDEGAAGAGGGAGK
jgi:CubicO group peptidase (beta-lactamase class C family)